MKCLPRRWNGLAWAGAYVVTFAITVDELSRNRAQTCRRFPFHRIRHHDSIHATRTHRAFFDLPSVRCDDCFPNIGFRARAWSY